VAAADHHDLSSVQAGRNTRWVSKDLGCRAPRLSRYNDWFLASAYHRLHLFSLDLSSAGKERAGGMGISVPTLPVVVSARIRPRGARSDILPFGWTEELDSLMSCIRHKANRDEPMEVSIRTPIYRHMGLGSSTQVLGTSAAAIASAYELGATATDLAEYNILDVGSCVGLDLLVSPGLLIDLGFDVRQGVSRDGWTPHTRLPGHIRRPRGIALCAANLPPWTVILVVPPGHGLTGIAERDFWDGILPTEYEVTTQLSHIALLDIVPAVQTHDFEAFISALELIASLPSKSSEVSIQGADTQLALKTVRDRYGFAGLSSMGPCVYTFRTTPITGEDRVNLKAAMPEGCLITWFRMDELRDRVSTTE